MLIPSYQISFHVFWKRLIPYSRFSKDITRIFGISGSRPFPENKNAISNILRFPIICFKMIWYFLVLICCHLVSPKINNTGLGSMDTFQNPTTMK